MSWAAVIGAGVGLAGAAMESDSAGDAAPTPLTPFQQLPPHMQELQQQQYNLGRTQGMTPWGGFNPNQTQGMNMIYNQAVGQHGYQNAAQNAVTGNAMGGQNPLFGMNNPFLQKQIDAAMGDMAKNFSKTTAPMLDAMNTRANTGFGTSSAMDELRTDAYSNLQDSMGKVSNDLRWKDYFNQSQLGEANANRQLQAAGMAPMLQNMGFNNANALLNMGNMQQQAPQQHAQYQMSMMGAPFGSLGGGTVMMPGTPGPNWLNGALGGALGGVSIYNQMAGGANSQMPQNNAAFYNDVYGFGGDTN